MKALTKTASVIPHVTLKEISAEKDKWEKSVEILPSAEVEKENSQPSQLQASPSPLPPPPPQSQKQIEVVKEPNHKEPTLDNTTTATPLPPPVTSNTSSSDSDEDDEPMTTKRRKLVISNSNFSDSDDDSDSGSALPVRSNIRQEDIDTSQSQSQSPRVRVGLNTTAAAPQDPAEDDDDDVVDDPFRIDLSQQQDDSSSSSSDDDDDNNNNNHNHNHNHNHNTYSSNPPITQFDALPDDDYCDDEHEENILQAMRSSMHYRNPGALVTSTTSRRGNRSLLDAVTKKSLKKSTNQSEPRWNGFKGSLTSFQNNNNPTNQNPNHHNKPTSNPHPPVVDLCESSSDSDNDSLILKPSKHTKSLSNFTHNPKQPNPKAAKQSSLSTEPLTTTSKNTTAPWEKTYEDAGIYEPPTASSGRGWDDGEAWLKPKKGGRGRGRGAARWGGGGGRGGGKRGGKKKRE
ncbi:hypothetical protein TL16_g06450 [Triparma laevis f. inornata]|uniref:Uncharacterized protein n=1 Tax=Triparma laevis f. inornata TaxID=1714386 RepID=A0A9W7ED51_9STRA|nr:hypothetical protein TL16_g06450 [Triparma laevis f. inornata]